MSAMPSPIAPRPPALARLVGEARDGDPRLGPVVGFLLGLLDALAVGAGDRGLGPEQLGLRPAAHHPRTDSHCQPPSSPTSRRASICRHASPWMKPAPRPRGLHRFPIVAGSTRYGARTPASDPGTSTSSQIPSGRSSRPSTRPRSYTEASTAGPARMARGSRGHPSRVPRSACRCGGPACSSPAPVRAETGTAPSLLHLPQERRRPSGNRSSLVDGHQDRPVLQLRARRSTVVHRVHLLLGPGVAGVHHVERAGPPRPAPPASP